MAKSFLCNFKLTPLFISSCYLMDAISPFVLLIIMNIVIGLFVWYCVFYFVLFINLLIYLLVSFEKGSHNSGSFCLGLILPEKQTGSYVPSGIASVCYKGSIYITVIFFGYFS